MGHSNTEIDVVMGACVIAGVKCEHVSVCFCLDSQPRGHSQSQIGVNVPAVHQTLALLLVLKIKSSSSIVFLYFTKAAFLSSRQRDLLFCHGVLFI